MSVPRTRTRTRTTVATALVLGAASIATVAAPAASAARAPGLLDCARTVQVRPKTFALACGDGNIGLVKARWQSFGHATARGTAMLAINGCDPNCADGSFTRTRVRVTATRVRTLRGKRTYTRLSLRRSNGRSAGQYGIDARGPYARDGR